MSRSWSGCGVLSALLIMAGLVVLADGPERGAGARHLDRTWLVLPVALLAFGYLLLVIYAVCRRRVRGKRGAEGAEAASKREIGK